MRDDDLLAMPACRDAGRVTAILGPTNTGKTYLALERMLGHASGMIGFPLRLLARENYDRVVRLKGAARVALITGEERIVPPNPSWFVCTVEAMPLERSTAFVAIDEVQLAADPERGHVFTDRILHARGRDETMLLGSDTIRPILKRLVPEAEFVARPRFSTLTYTGPRKITRMPPRSAVIAFALPELFEIAELVRRERGGTAIVMGALSPRARNAQVAMFESGEVDYLVATDAIGMGLNMALDHVAFARLGKFDGRASRPLTAPEIAQIAGRAGRHMNDGTFGTTAEAGAMAPEIVESVESHRFDPLKTLWWRNAALDFRGGDRLLASLERSPPSPLLLRRSDADDHHALAVLLRQTDIAAIARAPAAVRLLWEVCQIPDFRKVMSEQHTRLLAQIFRHLAGRSGRLPTDWVARQITRLDRVDGDIDTLVQRIAHIRTWTYVTNREAWLADEGQWRGRAREIEDRLSDALHDRLTQRFVDRRAATLVRHMAAPRDFMASVSAAGEVRVESEFVGTMMGLCFVPDPDARPDERRRLVAAANRVLRKTVTERAEALIAAPDTAFTLDEEGRVSWQGGAVAALVAGDRAATPRIDVMPIDFLEGPLREAVRRRVETFLRAHLYRYFGTFADAVPDSASAAARGLMFGLAEHLGTLDRREAEPLVRRLDPAARKELSALGIRFGTETIYVDKLLTAEAIALRSLLWRVATGKRPHPPRPGEISVSAEDWEAAYGDAIGFRVIGRHAIRVDRLEQLAASLRRRARSGPFAPDRALARIVGMTGTDLVSVIRRLGYIDTSTDAGEIMFSPRQKTSRRKRKSPRRRDAAGVDSPFAKLRDLTLVP